MTLGHTIDGLRIDVAVRRSLVLRCASAKVAARVAADLALLDCETALEGASVHVSGAHAALEKIVDHFA